MQGSVEAVKQSLEKLSNDEVRVRCIHGGVGAITETRHHAGLGLQRHHHRLQRAPGRQRARTIAEREKMDIRLYRVIYNAIEDVEKAMKGMLAPKFQRSGARFAPRCARCSRSPARARSPAAMSPTARSCATRRSRLLRDSVVIHEGKRRFPQALQGRRASEVAAGYECGMGLENYNDIKEGDVIECFQMEEIEQ